MLAAWLVAAVLVLAALAAVAATRVPALERSVRYAVTPLVVLVALLVVADLGLVLRADAADRPDSMLTHVGYAVASVGLVPMLVVRRPAAEEPGDDVEPASLWVVAVALLAVAICVVRLVQTR
jgi:hypothetical protein